MFPATCCWAAEETLAERREKIENMTPAEKEQLRLWQERFAALRPEERERIVKLHEELQQEPEGAQLRQVMRRFYSWWKTLPSWQKDELLEMDEQQRVKKIKEFRQKYLEQAKSRARRLSPQDSEKALHWMEDYAQKYEAQLLKQMREDHREWVRKQGEWVEKQADPERQRWVMWMWLTLQGGRRGGPGRLPPERLSPEKPPPEKPPSDEPPPDLEANLAELRSVLSAEPRQELEALPAAADQWRTVVDWVREEMHSRWIASRGPRVNEEQLADFFEHELSGDVRDWLMRLSSDEMERELRRLYFTVHPPQGPGPGRWPPGPGGPGPDRGHPRRSDKGPPDLDKGPPPERPPDEAPAKGPADAR